MAGSKTGSQPKRADGSNPGVMSSEENWVGFPGLMAPSDPFGSKGVVGLERQDTTLSMYATYVPSVQQFGRHDIGQCEDAASCDDCTQMIQKDGMYTSQACVWYHDKDTGDNKCGVRGYVVDQLGEEPLESCERDWTKKMFIQLNNWACDGERLQNGDTPMLKDATLEACAEVRNAGAGTGGAHTPGRIPSV